MKGGQIGRRIRWRDTLVRRLRFPNWRNRPAPYFVSDARPRFDRARPRRVAIWMGGPLLKTWLRLRGEPELSRLPARELS